MNKLSTLNSEQKEAVGLLHIGTFLEYFDLMLYVHMAVLLNELFFPKTDDNTARLITAFSFCSTFIFRPVGALIFGYLGDNIGRKSTVIITTMLMATSCIVMATLPTYAQIGITASWILTICRIVQGMSSMGERIGAELYLTETITPPAQYPMVTLVAVSSSLGATAALGVAYLVTSSEFSWRAAFWIGAVIALVGSIARTKLRETPDFLKSKSSVENFKSPNFASKLNAKINHSTVLFFFLIQCSWPICFYFVYIYCSSLLKQNFGYSSEQIIQHNFYVSFFELISILVIAMASYWFHPLKIQKIILMFFGSFIVICPFLLGVVRSPMHTFYIQAFALCFAPGIVPAASIYFSHFPVLKRFTYASVIYALARALMYVITSFSLVYLIDTFSHWGILIMMFPVIIGCWFSIKHFENLEKRVGNLPIN